jgi:hypothetical protein
MRKTRGRSNLLRAIALAPLAIVLFSASAHADPKLPGDVGYMLNGTFQNVVNVNNVP